MAADPHLPQRWTERIFARLLVRYGSAFLRKWDGLDLDLVKADWSRRLAIYAEHPAALIYALDHLPEQPPTVDQFAEVARRAPRRLERPQLTGELASEQTRAAILAKVHESIQSKPRSTELQRLQERKASGRPMTQFHRQRLRELLDAAANKGDQHV